MFKFKRKHLTHLASLLAFVVLVGFSIPLLRTSLIDILKVPLYIFTSIRREVGAVVFFHRNFILSERLAKEAGVLKQQIAGQEELRLENERLRKLLAFKSESSYQLTAARVIGRSADSWSSMVIIDKGTRQGIRSGMAVVSYGGFLGRIVETMEATSKVLLISDPNLAVSAIIQRNRQEGLVSGTLGSYLVMRYLSEGADIEAGDIVITSGLNQVYPKGLFLGTVVDTGKDASGWSRRVLIKPAVNMSGIEEVLVIVQ